MEVLASMWSSTVYTKFMEKLVLPVLIAVHTRFMEILSPPEVHTVHLSRCLDVLVTALKFCGLRTETTECIFIKEFGIRCSVQGLSWVVFSSFLTRLYPATCRLQAYLRSSHDGRIQSSALRWSKPKPSTSLDLTILALWRLTTYIWVLPHR